MGVVVRRYNYRCGCKEVYKFPHTTYPYSSCIYTGISVLFTGNNL